MRDMARCLLLILTVATAFGQTPKGGKKTVRAGKAAPVTPEAPKPAVFPIESINVTGSRYSRDLVLRVAELKVGQLLVEKEVEAARDRLAAHGAFSSVAYKYGPSASGQGVDLVFEVVDFDQLLPFRFDRVPVSEPDIRAHLGKQDPLFTDRIPANKTLVERYRAALEELVRSRGGSEKIEARIHSENIGDLHVLFYPAGAFAPVAEVHFSGNQLIPTATLQNTIHAVAVGVEYREARFRELLQTAIVPLYDARGRLRVAFPKIEATPASGVKGMKVSVTVDEGPSFSFGDVQILGIGDTEKLVKSLNLKAGDVANMDLTLGAQEVIHTAVRRAGHMRVTSRIERKLIEKLRVCDVTFMVEPGPKFTFGKLLLKGLDLHGEHEVKRVWGMKPGQAFNADYPDYFLNKLKEDGVFDNLQNARSIHEANDKVLSVDVTLVFNEKRPKPQQ